MHNTIFFKSPCFNLRDRIARNIHFWCKNKVNEVKLKEFFPVVCIKPPRIMKHNYCPFKFVFYLHLFTSVK